MKVRMMLKEMMGLEWQFSCYENGEFRVIDLCLYMYSTYLSRWQGSSGTVI